MPKRKNDEILSSNVKKLLIVYLVWKTNRILHYGSVFFFMRLILVRIWRDKLPKYGRAIAKFFLGTALSTHSCQYFIYKFFNAFVNQIMQVAVFV